MPVLLTVDVDILLPGAHLRWQFLLKSSRFAAVCVLVEKLFTVPKLIWSLSILGVGHAGAQAEGSSCGSVGSKHGDLSSWVCSPGWRVLSHLCLGAGAVSLQLDWPWLAVSVPSHWLSRLCPSWDLCLGQQCTSRPFALVCND